jgi:transcriptional regulator with XRE-family HTH domain
MEWKTMITDLESRGYTQHQIANGIGTTQPHISNIKCGRRKNLAYKTGKKLIDLHRIAIRKAGQLAAAAQL